MCIRMPRLGFLAFKNRFAQCEAATYQYVCGSHCIFSRRLNRLEISYYENGLSLNFLVEEGVIITSLE